MIAMIRAQSFVCVTFVVSFILGTVNSQASTVCTPDIFVGTGVTGICVAPENVVSARERNNLYMASSVNCNLQSWCCYNWTASGSMGDTATTRLTTTTTTTPTTTRTTTLSTTATTTASMTPTTTRSTTAATTASTTPTTLASFSMSLQVTYCRLPGTESLLLFRTTTFTNARFPVICHVAITPPGSAITFRLNTAFAANEINQRFSSAMLVRMEVSCFDASVRFASASSNPPSSISPVPACTGRETIFLLSFSTVRQSPSSSEMQSGNKQSGSYGAPGTTYNIAPNGSNGIDSAVYHNDTLQRLFDQQRLILGNIQ